MTAIEEGRCYGQKNPMWGRGVMKVNRQVRSSVLDFERFDVSIVHTSAGLELVEHDIQPATIFTHTGYEPVSEELFHKLRAMTSVLRTAAGARLTGDEGSMEKDLRDIGGIMACRTDRGWLVIRILEADRFLPRYRVDRFTIASGLVREECSLSVKQITLDGYRRIEESVWEALVSLWEKACRETEELLRAHGLIDGTAARQFAEEYSQGMNRLLNGVYDVIDVHK